MHWLLAKTTPALIAMLALFSTSASALVFREEPKTGSIHASGPVELDDAEKLAAILTLDFKQRSNNVRGLTTITLDSPGGSLLGGLRLGYALRASGAHTSIPAGASCMSACAVAFLGGQSRTVSGQYGVHAASMRSDNGLSNVGEHLDAVQRIGSLAMAYAREMVGSSEVMVRALATSAKDISLLTDPELVAMNVITVASRPSQFGRTGFKCPSQMERTVLGAVCAHLDIAALDAELNALFKNVRAEPGTSALDQDQGRWQRYRNSCINDLMPNGYDSVVFCVREAYTVRRDQLLGMWLQIAAGKSRPGLAGWEPIKPY